MGIFSETAEEMMEGLRNENEVKAETINKLKSSIKHLNDKCNDKVTKITNQRKELARLGKENQELKDDVKLLKLCRAERRSVIKELKDEIKNLESILRGYGYGQN